MYREFLMKHSLQELFQYRLSLCLIGKLAKNSNFSKIIVLCKVQKLWAISVRFAIREALMHTTTQSRFAFSILRNTIWNTFSRTFQKWEDLKFCLENLRLEELFKL